MAPVPGGDRAAVLRLALKAARRLSRAVWRPSGRRTGYGVERLRGEGVMSRQALARALTERNVLTPRGAEVWTHTTVGRLLARAKT